MQDCAESQEQLLARAAAGDQEAFCRFVHATRNAVFRLALAIARNSADAEDILQETYLAAWRAAHTFRAESSARGWLLTIARHQAWRNGKQRTHEPMESDNLESLGVAAGWGTEDPERIAERAESTVLLRHAL